MQSPTNSDVSLVAAGTLTQNEMAVVRMWAGGRDHTQLQNMPAQFNPPSRMLSSLSNSSRSGSSSSGDDTPGTGSAFLSASCFRSSQAELPLGLDPRLHALVTQGIALNSNANLRLEDPQTGGYINMGAYDKD